MRRVRASVALKVHLATPFWQRNTVISLLPDRVEKLLKCSAHVDLGNLAFVSGFARDRTCSTELLQHHRSRATPAIPITKEKYTLIYEDEISQSCAANAVIPTHR
jgi:hypothetical protein